MTKLLMQKTEDYHKLVEFFMTNDLEFEQGEEESTDFILGYEVLHSDALVGGFCIAMQDGNYVLDGIAVDKIYRKMKIGELLLNKAISKVKERGADKLILVARAPQFFKKYGFVPVDDESKYPSFDCSDCEQFGKTCNPEILKLEF